MPIRHLKSGALTRTAFPSIPRSRRPARPGIPGGRKHILLVVFRIYPPSQAPNALEERSGQAGEKERKIMRRLGLCPSLFLRESPTESRYSQASVVMIILFSQHKNLNSYNHQDLFTYSPVGPSRAWHGAPLHVTRLLLLTQHVPLAAMTEGQGASPVALVSSKPLPTWHLPMFH